MNSVILLEQELEYEGSWIVKVFPYTPEGEAAARKAAEDLMGAKKSDYKLTHDNLSQLGDGTGWRSWEYIIRLYVMEVSHGR